MSKDKKEFLINFNVDFNLILGSNIQEKIDSIFICLYRASRISHNYCGIQFDSLIVSPLVYGMMLVSNKIQKNDLNFDKIEHQYVGIFYDMFNIFIDEKTYNEHHVIMTKIEDGFLPDCSKKCGKFSISNLIMSNLFGYYNL